MTHVLAELSQPLGFIEDQSPVAASVVRSRAVSRSCIAALAIVLGYGVFSAGGRDFIAWTTCLLSIGLVSLVFWLATHPRDLAPIERWLVWAVILPSAYVSLQLVPLPIGLLRVLSPERAALASALGSVMPPPSFAAISINPAVTLAYLLSIIGYTLAFLLVREIAHRSQPGARWLVVLPLILVALAEALLGLVQAADGSVALGTYRNRNHLAGLLEMALPLTGAFGFAVLLERGSMRRGLSLVRALAAALVFAVAGLVMAGLVATSSKMGFTAALCGLFAMGTMAVCTTCGGVKKWASVAGIGAACLFAFVLLPTDQFVTSFGNIFSGDIDTSEGRWPIAQDTLHLLAAYPVVGSGFGTFGTAFLKHQTTLTEFDFPFAHNDYLELATEVGGAGFPIFVGLMCVVLGKAVRAGTDAVDWHTRALGLGCSGAIVAIAVHSLADFNMYIPANPLVLAWISGIAVCLPGRFRPRGDGGNRALLHKAAVVLTGALVLYAGGRVLLEKAFRGNLRAERLFCGIGICDLDVVLAAQAQAPGGTLAPQTIPALTDAVRHDTGAPARWCDLGEAMVKAGRVQEARRCFSTALALGPNIPPILWRAATFYDDLGEGTRALSLASRLLDQTSIYDATVFNWYQAGKMPMTDILGIGLPDGGGRASHAYLRYLITTGDFNHSALAWDWLLGRHQVDAGLARDYASFLYDDRRYGNAARSWAAYLGDRRNGYLDSTQLFNGGFEAESLGSVFDWRIETLADAVVATVDSDVAHGGTHSLALRFAGSENANYHHTYQSAFVEPGLYRFQAFVRTQGITTDQGIRFHLVGGDVNVTTEQVAGTSDWTRIQQLIRVPKTTQLLVVQVTRQSSLKFDSHISGSAWIDDVSLTRIE
jgi:hypothetical protein